MPTYPFDTIQTGNATFPKVLFEEQGSDPTTPASGKQNVYPKTSNGHLHAQDDAGAVRDIEAIQQTLSADPASPVNGSWWLVDDGGSPASVAIRFRKGGVTYTLAEVTV